MKSILKLFGRADGGYPALDVMVGDAKKILGFFAMPTLTHTSIFSLVLDGSIGSLQFKGIVASRARFRPPLFTLKKNGVVFGALCGHRDCASLIIGILGAGFPLGLEFLKLTRRVGINRLSAATINIYKGKQRHYQDSCDTDCGDFHRVPPRWVKPVYISRYNKGNELSIHFHLQEFSFFRHDGKYPASENSR
jgi:hypothetical protein